MSKKNKINKEEISRTEIRKKAQIRRKQKRKNLMIMISIALIGIIIIFIGYSAFSNPNNVIQDNNKSTNPSNIVSGSQISIPLSDISKTAQYYSYDADSVEVKYFAVKGSDGEIHVALDACDVCYGARKGYTQVEDVMRCINCGNQYPINSLGTENTAGGCWPSYLPIKIEGNNILINESELEDKRYMFG